MKRARVSGRRMYLAWCRAAIIGNGATPERRGAAMVVLHGRTGVEAGINPAHSTAVTASMSRRGSVPAPSSWIDAADGLQRLAPKCEVCALQRPSPDKVRFDKRALLHFPRS